MKIADADVVIDVLRDHPAAVSLIRDLRRRDEELLSSEIVRFEVLSGMRVHEEGATERLLREIEFVPVTEAVARLAAGLARAFRPAFGGIDNEDFILAATAMTAGADLLTRNVRHFPMFEGLRPAY